MFLSADMVYETLAQHYRVEKSQKAFNGSRIYMVSGVHEDSGLSGLVYLVPSDAGTPAYTKGCCYVFLNQSLPEDAPDNVDCMAIPDGAVENDVRIVLYRLFAALDNWQQRIMEGIGGNASIKDLMDASIGFFGIEAWAICTKDFATAATSSRCKLLFPELKRKGALDGPLPLSEAINVLKNETKLIDLISRENLFSYKLVIGEQPIYSYVYQLYYNGEYFGRLIGLSRFMQASQAALDFTSCLGNAAGNYMMTHIMGTDSPSGIHRIFSECIAGKSDDASLADALDAQLGWNRQDALRMLATRGETSASKPLVSLSFLAEHFEQRDSSILCIDANNGLCILQNTRICGQSQSGLSDLLKETHNVAGASNVFRDLSHLADYFREAQIALELADQGDARKTVTEFPDVAFRYLCKQCCTELPARETACKAIGILDKYDGAHPGSSLLETLKVYSLCNYRASEAARQLSIHITTFYYRLDRIKELTGVDTDNRESLVYLSLSFMLLGKVGR